MTKTISSVLAIVAVALGAAVLAGSRGGLAEDAPAASLPRHDSPPSASGNLVVELCDGKTAAEIPGVKEGETPSREQAEAVELALEQPVRSAEAVLSQGRGHWLEPLGYRHREQWPATDSLRSRR